EDRIFESLEPLKLFKIIQGWRGKPKGDLEALVKAVLDFARLAEHHHHKLVQAEINPLAILPEGKGVKILDALIEIKEN
ncbi:MAG: acetate--CoA ligase family protein, partial [SAR324 cluster bacterium]|nr:acetate--CoA ligase family protein [SAR324 cluster bacterium]